MRGRYVSVSRARSGKSRGDPEAGTKTKTSLRRCFFGVRETTRLAEGNFRGRAAGAAAGERAASARGGWKLEIRGLDETGGARTAPRTWHPAPTAPEVTTITLHPARLKSEHASASAPSMDRCKWPLRSRELVPTLITTTLCLRSAFPTRGAPAGEVFMLECISRSVAMRGK